MRSVAARILLVQSGDQAQQVYRLNLELSGFTVTEAADGEQALCTARTTPLDLIILDLALPVLDGWVVLGELKTDEVLRSIPVVILTASAEETTELQARERGAIAFLAKPIAIDDLTAAIHRSLAHHGGSHKGSR